MSSFPHCDRAFEYADQVVGGTILACEWARLACQRQLHDLDRFAAFDSAYVFDHQKAERICQFIENFPHVKGEWARGGGKIRLEPWQCFSLTTVFGWQRRARRNVRRFRLAYLDVGRKNAKSTLASGVGLYLLAADNEPGAVVVSAATTRDQARLCFNDAQSIARREVGFRRAFGVKVLAHAITQERGIALALAHQGDDLHREELSFAFGFVGQVEDLADVLKRR